MKVGIVGAGLVGSTAAYAMVMNGVGREIVMVDMSRERAQAQADDISHAIPFAHPLDIHAGDYADLAGSRAVVIAAGVSRKPDESRTELLARNAGIFREVVPQVLAHAPEAVLVIATNPVDVMTHLTARLAVAAGLPATRILGSGTTLDTARFRALLSDQLGVDPQHVHGYVVGEHGDSQVLTWSQVTIGGVHLDEYCRMRGIPFSAAIQADIDKGVRFAGRSIIAGKGATYYGIGSALTRIVGVVLHDQRAIMTVCTPQAEVAGVADVTVSLPHLISGRGVLATLPIALSPPETVALQASARSVREAIAGLTG